MGEKENNNALPEYRQEAVRVAQEYRKRFLTYREAELMYSLEHREVRKLAEEAGAIYRLGDGQGATTLVNREIFDAYLEKFRQPPKTRSQASRPKNRYEIRRQED